MCLSPVCLLQIDNRIRPPLMMGRCFQPPRLSAEAYSVWLFHQSGARPITGVGRVVVVGVTVRIDVPRVGRAVSVWRSEPPVGGEN